MRRLSVQILFEFFLITIYFDILAAGGRYDDLIQAYSSKLNIDDDSSKFQAPGGVGVYFF